MNSSRLRRTLADSPRTFCMLVNRSSLQVHSCPVTVADWKVAYTVSLIAKAVEQAEGIETLLLLILFGVLTSTRPLAIWEGRRVAAGTRASSSWCRQSTIPQVQRTAACRRSGVHFMSERALNWVSGALISNADGEVPVAPAAGPHPRLGTAVSLMMVGTASALWWVVATAVSVAMSVALPRASPPSPQAHDMHPSKRDNKDQNKHVDAVIPAVILRLWFFWTQPRRGTS
jgi:hypothetical protein